MKWFKILILFLVTLFIAMALLIETSWGKALVQKGLVYAIQRSGIPVEVEEISGQFPQEIIAKNVRLQNVLAIEQLHLKLSLLPLIVGKLEIEELEAENVQILTKQVGGSKGTSPRRSPLAVQVRHYRLTNVHWKDLSLTLDGYASMSRSSSIYSRGTLTRSDVPDAALAYEVARSRLGKIEGDFELSSPNLSVLQPWIKTEAVDGKIVARAHLRGTLGAFTGGLMGRFYDANRDREWAFKTRMQKNESAPVQFQKIIVSTQGLRITGSGDLNASNALQKADFKLRSHLQDLDLPIQGTLTVQGSLEKAASNGFVTKASFTSPALEINGVSIHNISGSIDGAVQEKSFQGMVATRADLFNTAWAAQSYLKTENGSIAFEDLRLDSKLIRLDGDVTFVQKIWDGKLLLEHAHLSLLPEFGFPLSLTGLAEGSLILFGENGKQQVQTDLTLRNVHYDGLSIATAHITSDNTTHILADMERIRWKKAAVDLATVQLIDDAFSAHLSGRLLELDLGGQFSLQGPIEGVAKLHSSEASPVTPSITFHTIEGRLLQHGVHLLLPTQIAWDNTQISLDRLLLAFGQGTIDGTFQQSGNTIDAQLAAKQLPLDVLSFYPMETRGDGVFDATASIHKVGKQTDASWNLSLEREVWKNRFEEERPSIATAVIEGTLIQDKLNLKSTVQVQEKPTFDLALSMPFHVSPTWQLSFPPGTLEGYVKGEGQLEDLLDFVDLGMHQVAGHALCDLTFARGTIQGTGTIENGYYQNYVTGTELENIRAHFVGAGDKLLLQSFNAMDYRGNEVLSAFGYVQASSNDFFPFHFDAQFDHLNIVQIDLVSATAEGAVSINGNLKSALATGALKITESDITIPTHIPRSYPDLQVIYKQRPITPVAKAAPKRSYPLNLDLKIEAPKAIFIAGRGLNSEWNGNFTIGGTYKEPAIDGSLLLLEGEFSFAGKRFKLNQGSLALQGNQYKMPLIDITGTTTEKAISISARIKGPLNHPQLTFQSVPPLPLSAILSHLLFGKDLSDVTGLQALQLAGTVASIAGEGPDILEITRKSLGVDRLQIVMTPTKSGEGYEGKETIALQVGKVLTPGVIVTIRQTAFDSDPEIGIEVDLIHGFVFEAETQQQPEQGKFSLKWNVNY